MPENQIIKFNNNNNNNNNLTLAAYNYCMIVNMYNTMH